MVGNIIAWGIAVLFVIFILSVCGCCLSLTVYGIIEVIDTVTDWRMMREKERMKREQKKQ